MVLHIFLVDILISIVLHDTTSSLCISDAKKEIQITTINTGATKHKIPLHEFLKSTEK